MTKEVSCMECVVGRFKNEAVKDVSVREWDCPNCGRHHDRDINAAINIREEALRIYRAGTARI